MSISKSSRVRAPLHLFKLTLCRIQMNCASAEASPSHPSASRSRPPPHSLTSSAVARAVRHIHSSSPSIPPRPHRSRCQVRYRRLTTPTPPAVVPHGRMHRRLIYAASCAGGWFGLICGSSGEVCRSVRLILRRRRSVVQGGRRAKPVLMIP